MSLLRTLADSVRPPDPRPIHEIDDEILEELQFHIEMRTRDNVASGMPADSARQDALRRFGDFDGIHRACRRILVGERIMLQRLQAVLTLVLLGAVIYLGIAHYLGQRANEAALAKMTETLEKMAGKPSANGAASEAGLMATLAAAPPVVMETVPKAGATDVDPGLQEIRVTYSKEMLDGSWSWSQTGEDTFPEASGDVRYLADGKTCVMPVKLQPGKRYEIWLNSQNHRNFQDREGRPAIPHFLYFETLK